MNEGQVHTALGIVCVCEGEPVQGLGEPESVHAYGCVCVYEQVCTHVSMPPVCVYMWVHMNVSVCMCGGKYECVYTHMQTLFCLADHAYYASCLAVSHCAPCSLNPG